MRLSQGFGNSWSMLFLMKLKNEVRWAYRVLLVCWFEIFGPNHGGRLRYRFNTCNYYGKFCGCDINVEGANIEVFQNR